MALADKKTVQFIYLAWSFRAERILRYLISIERVPLLVFQLERDASSLDGFCRDRGITYIRGKTFHDPIVHEKITSLGPGLFLLANYVEILSAEELNIPEFGAIVTHDGKLPEARGSSPINWALINDEPEGGASIFKLEPGLDTGPVLYQERYDITEEDNAASLLDKNIAIYCRGLKEIFNNLENGTLEEIPQDPSKAGFYKKRYPEDGLLDLTLMEPRTVHNYTRALVSPYPGAFSFYNGKKIIFRKTSLEKVPDSVCIELPKGKIWLIDIECGEQGEKINARDYFDRKSISYEEFEKRV